MRLSLFGPVRLEVAGREVPLAPPRLAQVVTILGLSGDSPVRIEELVDALWPDDPPSTAVNQVQRLIGQARRLFEPELDARATGAVLLGSGTSYRLVLDAEGSDVEEFRRMLRDARDAPPVDRLRCYLAALRLAHSPVAADAPDDGAIGALKRRIERDRIRVFLDAVALGSDDPEVSETLLDSAAELGERHPLDEAVQEARARILLASGRRTLALELIRSTEDRLRAELGVGAGPRLKATYVDVLRTDDDDRANSALPLPVGLRSLYLPRPEPTALLDAAAADARNGGSLVVVSGMGGIGKTTLVCEWSRAAEERFHDGVLYFDARGVNPAVPAADAAEARSAVLHALGEPADPDAAPYRAALRSRELILILDNVPSPEFVRDLLPDGGRSLVVAISRNALPGLIAREGAFSLPIDVLTEREGADLLAIRLGRQGEPPTGQTVERLLDLCGGLPLALTIACARGLGHRTGGMAVIAEQVESAGRLDLLSPSTPDASVRATLSWSVDRLSADASALFRALSVYPGAAFSIPAAESLLGPGSHPANAAIAELLGASLLTVDEGGRLQMHDLLRALAAERLDDEDRAEAERRLVQHFVRTAGLVSRLSLGRDLDLSEIQPGPAETLDDFGSATDWFFEQKPAITEVIWLAVRRGLDLEAALLGAGLSFMFNRIFAVERDLPLFEALVGPSDRSGRAQLAMAARNRLANRLESLGRSVDAEPLWDAAEAWARSSGSDEDLADTLRMRASSRLYRRDRDLALVTAMLGESVSAARRTPGGPALAMGLIFWGDALRQAGRLEEAAGAFAEIGHLPSAPRFYRAVSFSFLATTLLELGRLPEAVAAARTSLDLLLADGSADGPTLAYQVIATACLALRDLDGAADACAGFRRSWSPEALERAIARQVSAGEDVNSPFAIAPIAAEILRVEGVLAAVEQPAR